MSLSVVVMAISLAIALLIILIVSVGVRGKPSGNASDLTLFMAKTARHLNGQAGPPAKLQNFVESIPMPHSAASANDKSEGAPAQERR